jgi:hypothetical protein
VNPKPKTIELITRNARHCKSGDPLAIKVKSARRLGILHGTFGMKVKASPVTVTGKRNAFSILLAEPVFKSCCCVTAPGTNDSLMMQAQNLVRYEQTATGGVVPSKGDLAQRANKVLSQHKDRQWTMLYGYFNNLRNCLVEL